MISADTQTLLLSDLAGAGPAGSNTVLHLPLALQDAFLGSGSVSKSELLNTPILMEAQIPGADGVAYPMVACWVDAETLLGSPFAAFSHWLEQVDARQRCSPLLLLSRAEGHWSLPFSWEPAWDDLLFDADPSGHPDGRVLVSAATPRASLRDALCEAVEHFLQSMRPASTVPFPAATFLARCGRARVVLEPPYHGDCYVSYFHYGKQHEREPYHRYRVAAPEGYSSRLAVEGNLLWGTWRASGAAQRFVCSSTRADKALKVSLKVTGQPQVEAQRRFAESLFRNHPNSNESIRASILGVEGEGPTSYLQSMASRIRDGLQRALETDYTLRHALEQPRALLVQQAWESAPSLYESAVSPNGENPLDGGDCGAMDVDVMRQPSMDPSVFGLLRRPKDSRVMLPPVMRTAELPSEGDRVVMESYGGELSMHWEGAQSNGRGETEFHMGRLFRGAAGSSVGGYMDPTLSASIDIVRPVRYLRDGIAALVEWLEKDRYTVNVQRMREQLDAIGQSSPDARLRVEWNLPGSVLRLLWRLPNLTEPGMGRAHRAVANVQRALRVCLPLLARKETSDLQDFGPNRAFMVYAHSHSFAATRKCDVVPDPLVQKNVCRVAYSAIPSLRRRFRAWEELLEAEGVAMWAPDSLQFGEQSVDRALIHHSALLRLLVQESYLCIALDQLNQDMRGHSNIDRERSISRINEPQQCREITRGIHQALSRIYPGGGGTALAQVVLLLYIAGLTMSESRIQVQVSIGGPAGESDGFGLDRFYAFGAASGDGLTSAR